MKKKRRVMEAQIIQKETNSGKLIAENQFLKIAEKQPISENR
jgi:hypothetical protein